MFHSDSNTPAFVETIRVENGEAVHTEYHEKRMAATLRDVYDIDIADPHAADTFSLRNCFNRTITQQSQAPQSATAVREKRVTKWRVVYNGNGILESACEPYTMRQVRTLRMVTSDTICYTYKSTDREAINRLYAMRGRCDDVVIVRNGLLTDTSIANIALYDGKRWLTPRLPLLRGTHRAALLDSGLLHEADIAPADLRHFSRIRLFNAMIGWGDMETDTEAVRW